MMLSDGLSIVVYSFENRCKSLDAPVDGSQPITLVEDGGVFDCDGQLHEDWRSWEVRSEWKIIEN
jgi:hypothetical protein